MCSAPCSSCACRGFTPIRQRQLQAVVTAAAPHSAPVSLATLQLQLRRWRGCRQGTVCVKARNGNGADGSRGGGGELGDGRRNKNRKSGGKGQNGSGRTGGGPNGSGQNGSGNPWRPPGRYDGTGAWRDLANEDEWEKWERSWSEDPLDDSWADTTRDNRPRNVPGRRVDPIRGPRDAYLRPMIDSIGIRQRFAFKSQVGEEELTSEFEVNMAESRQAVSFAAFMFLVPLVAGFCVSRLIAEPIFHVVQQQSPSAFSPSETQKVEGAALVHKEEMRLQMDVAIGKAPPLNDAQTQEKLREEAHHLLAEFREENKQALLNVISDSITGVLLFTILALNNDGRKVLFRTIGRVFGGLSDTAKAFLIIASTDILLGYHSEEGWTAAIRLILSHYGTEVEEDASHIFVAIVPVVLDSIFKYWIFVGLNRRDPAATVTLRSMDRH